MFIEAKGDRGGGDNWTTGAISRAKLQSNHHHQHTNIQFFLQAGCPSCRPTDSVKALKGKISHSMDLLTPSSPGGLPTLYLTTNSFWFPWGGLPCLSSALWCQYPSIYYTQRLKKHSFNLITGKKLEPLFIVLIHYNYRGSYRAKFHSAASNGLDVESGPTHTACN